MRGGLWHSQNSVDEFFFFFFQAEDGIRDLYVTGVQTCALPISPSYVQSIRDTRCSPRSEPYHTRCTLSFTHAWQSTATNIARTRYLILMGLSSKARRSIDRP